MAKRASSPRWTTGLTVLLLALCLSAKAVPEDSTTTAALLVRRANLAELRWPRFDSIRSDVERLYANTGYQTIWVQNGRPTPQALAMITALKSADAEGLRPEDYDATRWDDRVRSLRKDPSADHAFRFDLALTVCTMRYITHVYRGRVPPRSSRYNIQIQHSLDRVAFIREKLIHAADVPQALRELDPPFEAYRRVEDALQRYLQAAAKEPADQLPPLKKSLRAGDAYPHAALLGSRLRLLGDLPQETQEEPAAVYSSTLAEGVRHFQARHGLTPDGVLGRQTIAALNVRMHDRIQQLQLTLERWRWMPRQLPQPPIIVNITESRLRALADDYKVALSMNVIVGRAYQHKTPVFVEEMDQVIFRPYWEVPKSIVLNELLPKIRRDRSYLERNEYEMVDGNAVVEGPVNDELLQRIQAGALRIRQRPGSKNALGLIKLLFPNQYDVYLHGTPLQSLFQRGRRDFSHGCIRVEAPDQLGAWALRKNKGWGLEQVRQAMESGPDSVTVMLQDPIPVLILYSTARVDENGDVQFFQDIYGYDEILKRALRAWHPQ